MLNLHLYSHCKHDRTICSFIWIFTLIVTCFILTCSYMSCSVIEGDCFSVPTPTTEELNLGTHEPLGSGGKIHSYSLIGKTIFSTTTTGSFRFVGFKATKELLQLSNTTLGALFCFTLEQPQCCKNLR